jgi:hypothetical protein
MRIRHDRESLAVIIGAALAAFVVLGRLPGQIARQRNHPNADAINAAGWLGVITMGILWPLGFIWAHTNPVRAVSPPSDQENANELVDRIAALEARLAVLGGSQSREGSS